MTNSKIKALALYDAPSGIEDAYVGRVRSLLKSVADKGVEFEEAWLWDMPYKRPMLRRIKNAKHIRIILEEGKFDYIHGANPTAAYAGYLAGKPLGIPCLFDCHGDVVAEAKDFFKQTRSRRAFMDYIQSPFVDKKARTLCPHILVVSTPQKEHYLKLNVPENIMSIVRNGVDISEFQPEALPPTTPITIGYAGAMQIWQGLPLLLEAVSRVKDDRLKYIIMGFGPEDEKLKQEFENRTEGRAELINRQPRWMVKGILSKAHALVIPRLPMPTTKVAMPTKFGEYLALGRPVLLTEVDETAKFVRENKCGWVIEPTAKALADAFIQIADTPHEQLTEYAKNARNLAENVLDWNKIGEDYFSAVKTLLSQSGK